MDLRDSFKGPSLSPDSRQTGLASLWHNYKKLLKKASQTSLPAWLEDKNTLSKKIINLPFLRLFEQLHLFEQIAYFHLIK